MRSKVLTSVVLVVAATACGSSVPPPNDQWAAAQADLGRAEASGAASNPDARLHVQLAQEDLASAHRLMGRDNVRATTLTQLARAEAQLASSLAAESAANDDASKAAAEMQGGRP
ncbi:MAG TPA: DUF4398 domain-containing protein [Polyangiaceae bacterium]